MHLIYIDEVKFHPPVQPWYWLCGLAIPSDAIIAVEESLNSIAEEYFGTRVLDKQVEFHAVDIVNGKGPYKQRAIADRLALLKRLTSVVTGHPEIGRIQIRLEPGRISRDDYQRIAFMYFIERADQLLSTRKSIGMLIADHDREFITDNVKSLSAFRASGTDWQYGQEINRLIDTVHHTESHHSRLLQLADIYVYAVCASHRNPTDYIRGELVKHVRELDPFLFPTKFKYWPPEAR